MHPLATLLSAALLAVFTGSAAAHELWISPLAYRAPATGKIKAHIRVGQKFDGAPSAFNPVDFTRFDVIVAGQTVHVKGRLGDLPALSVTAPAQGLAIVVHQTSGLELTYGSFEKFARFVRHKDFPGVLERHRARALPMENFSEKYRRFAKSLIAIGHGRGHDQRIGLETEIVAGANPYTDDLTAGMPLRVFDKNQPRANAQVEVFARSRDNTVIVTLQHTDKTGNVTIPVKPNTQYLIDAVAMRELAATKPETDPVWESLWASLTFKTGPGLKD